MKINNNISAVITNNQLLKTEGTLSESMERLSSGLRINHASDDPSGMAIAGKMQAQIDGLDQASRNASDGTSVLQTADGAISEVTSMLQRMRELAVQAANGTNSQNEKEAIQQEIATLRDEIDRVSQDTEFNTKSLLDGTLDTRVYGDHIARTTVSEYVAAGHYSFTVDSAATQAVQTSTVALTDGFTVTKEMEGTVSVNGYEVKLTQGMTGKEVYEALRKGAEIGETTISDYGDPLAFTTKAYGAEASVAVTASNTALATALGLPQEVAPTTGENAKVSLDTGASSEFGNQATVAYNGNKITITDVDGFDMSMQLEAGYAGAVDLEVTNMGTMSLQIGANSGQMMDVKIPAISSENLYIDDLDVTTVQGGSKAISALDDALSRVNAIRSKIGAYENRLEYAVGSLDETGENMTSAISRVNDVDMAEEMTIYTQQNVLAQAATSALSQANELPQMALQLLQ